MNTGGFIENCSYHSSYFIDCSYNIKHLSSEIRGFFLCEIKSIAGAFACIILVPSVLLNGPVCFLKVLMNVQR